MSCYKYCVVVNSGGFHMTNILARSLEHFANLDGLVKLVLDATQFEFTDNSGRPYRRLAFVKEVDLNAIDAMAKDRANHCIYDLSSTCEGCTNRDICENYDINLFTSYYHICEHVKTNLLFYLEDDVNQTNLNTSYFK